MAIQWGSWSTSSTGNGMRVGVDVTLSAVSGTSPTCTVAFKVYTENRLSYADSQSLVYGGTAGITGTLNYQNNSGAGVVLRDTKTWTYTYPSSGAGTSKTFTAAVTGAIGGIAPSVSVTASPPTRPAGIPSAPASVVATRNSDTQATVTWTNPGAAGTSVTVERREFSTTWGAWAAVATLGGTATSYVSPIQPNRLYMWRVRRGGSGGVSALVDSNLLWTTPAAPTGVAAVPAADRGSVTLTWQINNPRTTANLYVTTIEKSVGGGVWTAAGTYTAPAGATSGSWTDPTPVPAAAVQYRLAVTTPAGVVPTLTSAWAVSNVIATAAPPLAPVITTSAFPSYQGIDVAGGAATVTWQHRPGPDAAAQSAFRVQFSTDDGATWGTPVEQQSGTGSYTIPAGLLPNGGTILYQVATQGDPVAGFGPWSDSGVLLASSRGTITLDPAWPAPIVHEPPIEVRWATGQAEGRLAVQVVATLWSGGTLLETRQVYPDYTVEPPTLPDGVAFGYRPVDGDELRVEVRARFDDHQWSAVAAADVRFVALPPAAAVVSVAFDECAGAVLLHVESAAPEAGVTSAAVAVSMDRLVPGTADWLPVADAVPMPTDLVDVLPITNGENVYRITTISAAPTFAVQTETVPIVAGRPMLSGHQQLGPWAYLSYGQGYGITVRMRGDLAVSATTSRARSVHSLLGRMLPVALVGTARHRVLSVSGTIREPGGCAPEEVCRFDSTREAWEDAGWAAELACFRDWTGRRVFGVLGDLTVTSAGLPGHFGVQFTVTQVDHVEEPYSVGRLPETAPAPAPPPEPTP